MGQKWVRSGSGFHDLTLDIETRSGVLVSRCVNLKRATRLGGELSEAVL